MRSRGAIKILLPTRKQMRHKRLSCVLHLAGFEVIKIATSLCHLFAILSDGPRLGGWKRRTCGSTFRLALLRFCCAETVSGLHQFEVLALLFERKQIPQIIVNIRISRKPMEPLEARRLPWAQLRAIVSVAPHYQVAATSVAALRA